MEETVKNEDYKFEDYTHFKNFINYLFVIDSRNNDKFFNTKNCFQIVDANNKKGYWIVPLNDKKNYVENLYGIGKKEWKDFSAQTYWLDMYDANTETTDKTVEYLDPIIDRLKLLKDTKMIRNWTIAVHVNQKKASAHAHILIDSFFDFDYLNIYKNIQEH